MFLMTRLPSIASSVILSSLKSLWLSLPSLSLQGPEVGLKMLKLHEYNHQSVLIEFTELQGTTQKEADRTNASIGDALVDGMGVFQAL